MNFPYYIIVATAHTEYGQDENASKENVLSDWVSYDLINRLRGEGVECEHIEIWASKQEDGHSSLDLKVQEINRISERSKKPVLALEIHWNGLNSASGSCVLFDANSDKSKRIANQMLPTILKELGRGQHSIGVIPFPSAYRNIALKFLRETHCPAVIIEVDSIKHFDEFNNNDWLMDKTSKALCMAILGINSV